MIGAFVRQLQGTVDIVLDGILLWRQSEKELMEPCLHAPGLQPDGSVKDPAKGQASVTCRHRVHKFSHAVSPQSGMEFHRAKTVTSVQHPTKTASIRRIRLKLLSILVSDLNSICFHDFFVPVLFISHADASDISQSGTCGTAANPPALVAVRLMLRL